MTKTQDIRPGQIIRFKRFPWMKRYAGMIVDTVDGDFLTGRAYRLGTKSEGIGRVTLAVTSMTVVEAIG